MRDVESLCEKAGLGKLSQSTASRICTELHERFEQFKCRDLYEIRLAALFLDAAFLSARPDGPKEGVLVAWGVPRRRRAGAGFGDTRDARIARGLA
jgi:transposase-like protein